MASLENVQGLNNQEEVKIQGISPGTMDLLGGADALARGRDAGFTDDETLQVYARRQLRRAKREQEAEAFRAQHSATIAEVERIPLEQDGTRQLTNMRFAMARDGGERDQSEIDESFGRDENAFSYYDREKKRYQDVYIEDGNPTPPEFKDRAQLRDAGLMPDSKEVGITYKNSGRPVIDRRTGKQKTRTDYDRATASINETSVTQRGPLAAAHKKLTDALAAGKVTLDTPVPDGTGTRNRTVRDVLDSIELSLSPQEQIALDKSTARDAVIEDSERFSDARAMRNAVKHDAMKQSIMATVGRNPNAVQGLANIEGLGEQPISQYQALYEGPSGMAKGNVTLASFLNPGEFEKMPFAVPANEQATEIALSLGDDVSPWVDLASGEPVAAATPARVQTNMPNTSQQLNAPVAAAASWVAGHQQGKDIVQSTNINQSLADFSRRVSAFAPNYESRKVETVEDFSDAIAAVIARRQEQKKNFYLKDASGKNRKVEPGIDPALQILGLTSGEADQLATALYLRQTSPGEARPVSSFSDGVTVNMGSLAGENIDLGQVQRKNRAAFKSQIPSAQLQESIARGDIDLDEDNIKELISFAQKPIIGAVRGYDESGKPVQEPPLTRAKMKGRSADEAVARYRQLQAQNGKPVDPDYEREIYEGNASLTADQAIEQQRSVARAEARVGSGNVQPPARVQEDADFSADAQIRAQAASRDGERRERIELIKLIKKGAQFGGETADRGRPQRQVPQADGRTLPAIGGPSGRRLRVPSYNDESLAAMTPENGVMKAPEAEDNPRSWSFNRDTLSIDRGEPVNTTPGREVNIEGIRGGADGNGPLAIQPGIRQRADLTRGQSPAQSRAAQGPGGALMSLRPTGTPQPTPTPVYDPGPKDFYDVEARFNRRKPTDGFNAVTPPAAEREATPADGAASRALKDQIAARVLQKRKLRRDVIGYGALGAGTLAATGKMLSEMFNGNSEEQYR